MSITIDNYIVEIQRAAYGVLDVIWSAPGRGGLTVERSVPRSGADLALLLLGSYRKLVDAAVRELAARGFEDVRPVHDFAMRAIAAGADSASELGRRMSVSKQAAARTIAILLARGYIARRADPSDRRRKHIEVTALGLEVMRTGEEIFDELRDQWERQLGERELTTLEAHLTAFIGDARVRTDAPGWVALELD